MRQQRGKEDKDGDSDNRLTDPATPLRVGMLWIKQQETGHRQDEEQHVNGGRALHQPCAQSAGGGFHSHSAPTNSAIATPPRFTAQALRRALCKVEPTLMSVSRCRTPANM